jgi:hypothetical protein
MPLPYAEIDEQDDEYSTAEVVMTKIDKDFNPDNYVPHTHTKDLSNPLWGCAGYRCTTFAAPSRTIPAGTQFMLGHDKRGCLCMDCFNKAKRKFENMPDLARCSNCETRIPSSRATSTVYDGTVCNSCIGEYYLLAAETDGGYITATNAQRVIRQSRTPLFASPAYARANWFTVDNGATWYLTAEDRDRSLYQADAAYLASRLEHNSLSSVFPYATNIIKMHGFPSVTKSTDLCLGVELEMQPNGNHTHVQVTAALGGKFFTGRPYILCADSSIGPNGVELITLPYTLAAHKSDKYMNWTKTLADLREVAKSGINTKQCGMHVHINRRALSHLQMGKMLVIVNAPEMQEFMVTIAQRSEADYCRRYEKKVADGGKITGSHSDALNMSNNKGTCELRIFRGNLRYERVMKNLEFAEALCLYAKEQSIQKVARPDLLVGWLEDNKAHYPHLVKFIREYYEPTKAFARKAKALRAQNEWQYAVSACTAIEPVEGDL